MSLITILIASLLGSAHCAVMCGSFVAIAAQSERPRYAQLSYHLGRLTTYMVLGCIAGAIGGAVNQLGMVIGISRLAAILTGATMIISALSLLFGKNVSLSTLAPSWFKAPLYALSNTNSSGATMRGYLLGLFSTLLPCGWLYTYAALAGSTGAIVSALLVMTTFWIGTLPVMLTVGSISHLIATPFRKYIPLFIALLMLIAGTITIFGHLDYLNPRHVSDMLCSGSLWN